MTLAELHTVLVATGLPVAYGEFNSTPEHPAPPPPFITYQFTASDDVMADNQNFAEVSSLQIELYTTKKDPTREAVLQGILTAQGLPYSKLEARLESERLRQVIYEIQLIGG